MRNRGAWFQTTSSCNEHGETSCDCGHRYRMWQFLCEGENYGLVIQQFDDGGPFYGTWECGGGGRTGPMTDLDACKTRLMGKINARSP